MTEKINDLPDQLHLFDRENYMKLKPDEYEKFNDTENLEFLDESGNTLDEIDRRADIDLLQKNPL